VLERASGLVLQQAKGHGIIPKLLPTALAFVVFYRKLVGSVAGTCCEKGSEMKLHELSPPEGARKVRKRVGRGPGSGSGKTSGKGHKGQKSRSGGGKKPGFEGGQMPLIRRIPKRGFTKPNQKKWAVVNLADLVRLGVEQIDAELLVSKGLVKGFFDGIKVLGDGEVERALQVRVHAMSESARRKVEAAGGSFEVVGQ